MINRRTFLKSGLIAGGFWSLEGFVLRTADGLAEKIEDDLNGFPVWDAHAHPFSFFSDQFDSTTPTIAMMKKRGLAVCVFAAVGDLALTDRRRERGNSPKFDTEKQLDRLKFWSATGEIKIIKTTSDLDTLRPGDLGAIVAIEGGDALEGRLENLDYFYEKYAVRLITLLHDTNNAIGRHQRAAPSEEGLTSFGRNLVERMNRLGMIIDVAHAQTNTLRDITALSVKAVVDSHTGFMDKPRPFSRWRNQEEMEWVAKTGGMIGLWPLGSNTRSTLKQWAGEIVDLKSRVGLKHLGLGTDGGGRLPKTVEGYTNIADLGKLVNELREVGLPPDEIRAFLGGNFERVVRANLKTKDA